MERLRGAFGLVDLRGLMFAEHWDVVADTFTFFSQLGIASRMLQQQATSVSS